MRAAGRVGLRTVAAGLVATVLLPGPAALANGDTGDRVRSLLDMESRSLDRIPEGYLDELAALAVELAGDPALQPRALPGEDLPPEVTLSSSRFDEPFIQAQPSASGGETWRCLTEALYFEARGEDLKGLYAVGEVILNRVEDPRFPDSVCDVVYQGTGRKYACQFTYTCDGLPETVHDQRAWNRVGKVARILLDGAPRDLTEGATHYHTASVAPDWSRVFPRTTTIGYHHFYRWD